MGRGGQKLGVSFCEKGDPQNDGLPFGFLLKQAQNRNPQKKTAPFWVCLKGMLFWMGNQEDTLLEELVRLILEKQPFVGTSQASILVSCRVGGKASENNLKFHCFGIAAAFADISRVRYPGSP